VERIALIEPENASLASVKNRFPGPLALELEFPK
jgi:hypothetical protein